MSYSLDQKERDGIHLDTRLDPVYPDADRVTVFQEALLFQDFIVDLLIKELGLCIGNYSSRYYQHNFGENRQGIEIKLDTRILETGNVSIEVAEKSKASNEKWIDSGIMKNDNSWLYIQGNQKIVFIFGKRILRGIYKSRYKDKIWIPKPTIMTFLFPITEAKKYSLKVFEL